MTKISVIVPTYNYGKYLARGLDSILRQTHRDFEIIIVDDGSTDKTRKVVIEYLEKFPNTIHYFHQTNQGPAAARNRGIEKATGSYIAFLDSDDFWTPDKLEKQLALFQQDPVVGLVFCDLKKLSGSKIKHKCFLKEKGYYPFIYGNNPFSDLIDNMFIFTSTVMLKKEIFPILGAFNETYCVGEDWDLWLRILNRYKIGFVPEPLVSRQVHEANLSGNKFEYCKNLICLKSSYLKSSLFLRPQKAMLKKQLNKHYFDFAYELFCNKAQLRAIPWFLKSFLSEFRWISLIYVFIAIFPPSVVNCLRKYKQKFL